MKKKVISLLCTLTIVAIVLSGSVVPVFASSVNYTVNVFVVDNSNNFYSSTIAKGQTRYYLSAAALSWGLVVTIPANTSGGYFVMAGYYPAHGVGSGSGWVNGTAATVDQPSYIFSSVSNLPVVSRNEQSGEPFTGMVYIPPHSSVLYLYIYSPGVVNANGVATLGQAGAIVYSNAFMQFVKDTSGDSEGTTQMLQQLQQINNNIQNVYNEITNDASLAQSEALLDQIQGVSQQITDLSDQLAVLVPRPPVASLVPDIGDILQPSDEASQIGLQMIGGVLSNRLIIALMTMVLTFSIIRYILYGKVGK